MTANVDAMLRAASDAVRANKKADARALLEKVIELDEYNEQAWIWLSGVVDSTEERRMCLENVLVINPDNETAARGLKQFGDAASPAPAAPSAGKTTILSTPSTPAFSLDDEDLFSDVNFATPAAETSTVAAWNVDDDPWSTPTSSSSSGGSSAFDSQIPDDWAASLVKKPVIEEVDEDSLFRNNTDDGESPFGSDPFGADPFGVTDFTPDTYTASASAFSEADFDSYATSAAPPAPSRYAAAPLADDFESVTSTPIDEDFGDLFTEEAARVTNTPRRATEERTAEELFGMIPKEIAAGRLPGMDGSLPSSARMMFMLAILINVGAFGLLIFRLIA